MSAAEAVAAAMLAALVLYTLTGGADFGGGVWDLLARGPRAAAQRRLIEHALAPVWEANHVWLILIVVLLFTGFPAAFASASIGLHVPLVLMLLGIVMRGSAFAFRKYDAGGDEAQRRWGRLFAVSSTVTPLFLGIALGAVTSGRLARVAAEGFFRPWLEPFALCVGALTLALCAYLAAVFLTVEADEPGLREDFRRRAIAAWAVVLALNVVTALAVSQELMPHFRERFGRTGWVIGAAALAAAGSLAALMLRRYRLARWLASAHGGLIVLGWGGAQYPYLIYPELTIATAAAPEVTLRLLLWALGAGAVVVIPSLAYLFRVFKRVDGGRAAD